MQKQKEVWLPVKGYEGIYEVSNLGRVKSLVRIYRTKEKILKGGINSRGYITVNLVKNKIYNNYSIHKLVAIAFLNHEPCGMDVVVDHINCDKLDNNVENLQLTTNRYNCSKDKKNCTSKYTGVHWNKTANKWQSRIRIGEKRFYLGSFDCELAAAKAYNDKLKTL